MTNEYKTPDLYFAAYLQSVGLELKRADKTGSRIFFVFDVSTANIEELKASWFNSTGKVVAHLFANTIRSLKARCHSE